MAPPRDETQLWHRRSGVIAAAGLVVLVIGGLLIAGGRSDDSGTDTTPVAAAPDTSGRKVRSQRIGATIARPRGWSDRSGQAIELRDPVGSTVVSIQSPRDSDRSAAVLKAAVVNARKRLKDVEVTPGPAKTVAGRPAVSAVMRATTPGGARVSILLSAVQGDRRVWLVQVISGPDPRRGRGLAEAQAALGTLRLQD